MHDSRSLKSSGHSDMTDQQPDLEVDRRQAVPQVESAGDAEAGHLGQGQ